WARGPPTPTQRGQGGLSGESTERGPRGGSPARAAAVVPGTPARPASGAADAGGSGREAVRGSEPGRGGRPDDARRAHGAAVMRANLCGQYGGQSRLRSVGRGRSPGTRLLPREPPRLRGGRRGLQL